MAEQSTQDNERNLSEKLSEALNNLSRKIVQDIEEENQSKFVFEKGISAVYGEAVYNLANGFNTVIAADGYHVELDEYIDIKNVTNESKYKIRISDNNGAYVEFSLFEYREVMLDYTQSESEYIYDKLLKMAGSNQQDLEDIADEICDYLQYLCHYRELQVKVYNSIGWDDYNGQKIFKYDEILNISRVPESEKINGIIREGLKAVYIIKSRNEMDIADSLFSNNIKVPEEIGRYLSQLVRVMKTSTKASLIIAAACTGLVRPLLPYSKEDNINMNIVGKRASGKSTICHFALSLFGDPQILEGSFVDSSSAMELIRVQRPVIPYILDERMLKVEDSSDKSKRQTILMDIFREYEGKAKEKLAGKGQEYSGQRTNAPIISSSVESMLDPLIEYGKDLGQYRRFIEIKLDKSEIFEGDSSFAETIENLAYTYYGYGVELIVSYIMDMLLEDEEFVEKKYEANRKEISETLKKIEEETGLSGLTSSAKRFSLIITTLDIIIKSIEHYESNSLGFEFENLCNEVADILIDNLVDKMKRVSLKLSVYDNIMNFLENHGNLFAASKAEYIDNPTKFLAYQEIKGNTTEIGFRRGKGYEWIMANANVVMSDEEILNYVNEVNSLRIDSSALKQRKSEALGEIASRPFESVLSTGDKGRVIIKNFDLGKLANGTKIILIKKEVDLEETESSDSED